MNKNLLDGTLKLGKIKLKVFLNSKSNFFFKFQKGNSSLPPPQTTFHHHPLNINFFPAPSHHFPPPPPKYQFLPRGWWWQLVGGGGREEFFFWNLTLFFEQFQCCCLSVYSAACHLLTVFLPSMIEIDPTSYSVPFQPISTQQNKQRQDLPVFCPVDPLWWL